eukprot:jgi/Botrbrau1/2035/Bobra.0047s0015.1
MVLRLHLVPDRTSYRPGEEVGARVEVWNDAPDIGSIIEVAGITVTMVGHERVDHTWVSTSYAESVPSIQTDARKRVRALLQTEPCILKLAPLEPRDRCQWYLRVQLPDDLPPTFRGVGVRYVYQFTISARVMDLGVKLRPVEESASDGRSSPTPSEAPSTLSRLAPAHSLGTASQPRSSAIQGAPRPTGLTVGNLLNSAESYAWREVNLRVPIHIWPPQQVYGPWKTGVVMGEDAQVAPIFYSVASPARPTIKVHVQELREMDVPPPLRIAPDIPILAALGHRSVGDALIGGDGGPIPHPHGLGAGRNSTASSPRSSISVRDEVFEPNRDRGRALRRSNSGGSPSARSASNNSKDAAWGGSSDGRAASARTSPSPTAAGDGSLRNYNLRVGQEILVALALHAPLDGSVELGSTLAGTLDMRRGQRGADSSGSMPPRCIQVVVTLETEEIIQPPYHVRGPNHKEPLVIRKVYDEQVEVTQDVVLSHFMFSVPYDAPPTFATQLVSLQWLLRFEFTAAYPGQTSGWLVQPKPPEKVTWSLPFLVRPPRG